MDSLKSVVKDLMQDWITRNMAVGGNNPQVWLKNILTKKELGHIKFRYFKKGILGVNIDSSSWLYSLNLRKQKLLAEFRKKDKTIKDIRFYLGEV